MDNKNLETAIKRAQYIIFYLDMIKGNVEARKIKRLCDKYKFKHYIDGNKEIYIGNYVNAIVTLPSIMPYYSDGTIEAKRIQIKRKNLQKVIEKYESEGYYLYIHLDAEVKQC